MDVEQSAEKPRPGFFTSVPSLIFRLFALAVIDAFGIWFIYQLLADGLLPLAVMLGLITLAINIIFLNERLYPLRWMAPGLALMTLMALYPVLFTIYTAFTNYSDGHILSKQQVIERLGQDYFLPEGGTAYSYTAFRSAAGEFQLWLTDAEGNSFLALPGDPLVPAAEVDAELDEEGIPVALDGYERLARGQTLRYLQELSVFSFGEEPDAVQVRNLNEAAPLVQRYVYDKEQDAIVDQRDGSVYFASEEAGSFISEDGRALVPGYQVTIGANNFQRLFTSSALRGPLIRIFIWTFAFAFLTVVTTFALGLFVALVFDDRTMVGRRLILSLLIIPYTIPSVISVLMWRGLLNPRLGIINTTLQDLISWAPAWTSDPTWAKVAIILINLWLGYPYMMLITSGALQAIPSDIYEAAEVDGASIWQRFSSITLPLLLISVGPILISSFTFNFNNFNVIYLFNEGGPPIAGTPTPAGHTDILLTYVYRLAFAGGRGADYAYAAAVSLIIFLILLAVVLVQFRFTRVWEEVSENV
ncbi:MAG: maltose ABC transporter permease MalF [Anaerolineae bacterium]|nr:maltose ABC transporter permease MalF [Anaerolineae bacterium]